MNIDDAGRLSMQELFRMEADSQTQVLTAGLLVLENEPTAADQLEACMRAAHSLKGAARIVGLDAGVSIAHAMEDCFVAAQKGLLILTRKQIDPLFRGLDLLNRIAETPEEVIERWSSKNKSDVEVFLLALTAAINERGSAEATGDASASSVEQRPIESENINREVADRVVRVTAENLNRLLGLAGESLVESRWLKPFAASLLRLKRLQYDAGKRLEGLREALPVQMLNEQLLHTLEETRQRVQECERLLSQRLGELEMFDRRSANLAHRLYDEAVACRMRPFADGVHAFPRMVRDLGHSLGKQVKLVVLGKATPVDRDLLEAFDAPLGHLLRNAVDHGIESPDERSAAGKSSEAVIKLEAGHSAGMLQITITDDGHGIDLDKLRRTIVERNLTNAEMADKLTEAELLEFLFLPGFSMKGSVTEISGRGVGLDVVQNMVRQMRGAIRVFSQPGKGMRFQLQFPLTLSVVRTLLVEIGGEPYAFPLAYVTYTLKLPKEKVERMEGREHFHFDGRQIGLVAAHQVLATKEATITGDELPIVVVGSRADTYGLVVGRFLGERKLVVQPLDARLGKIKDIAAGALMEDGSPVLIIDVEDMIRSMEKLVSAGGLSAVQQDGDNAADKKRKRVLVVDDSLTVRELERKLLGNRGYVVEVATDGMDGWNAVRTGHFDLVITDIDMPRMDGIELVTLIKKDSNLKSLPVMVVSYKDREEDKRRGLEAGADYYLAKGSFHDETMLQTVIDLIGEA